MRTFATADPIVAADHYHIPPLERIGDTLLSVLRQLRAGYDERPDGFPHSIVLCGVCDVRGYRVNSTAENRLVPGGSAFNIKSESLRLGDFSEQEIRALIAQHAISHMPGTMTAATAHGGPRCCPRKGSVCH